MKIKHKIIIATLAALLPPCLNAEIWMPSFFNTNMVLQREKPVKIWGTSGAKSKIEVTFNGQKKSATADSDGNWVVFLDPMGAVSTPQTMRVLENGKESDPKCDVRFNNVLVGEVWLLSGQSNMEWSVANTTDFANVKARANYPLMREMKVVGYTTNPQKNIESASKTILADKSTTPWRVTSPQNVGAYSGVGFYFAELLMKELKVPVGIINTSLGGSSIRAWIAEDQMESVPFLKKDLEKFKVSMKSYDYDKAVEKYESDLKKYQEQKAAGKNPRHPRKPSPITNRTAQSTPSCLYNARIAPLAGYTIRGILWYQGESDSGGESLSSFEDQMKVMISHWRKIWNDDSLGFYQVMLTSFQPGTSWPATRLAQCNVARNVPNCHIVNILDIGESKDIHPRNKTDVGKRLWLSAQRNTYGNSKINDNEVALDNVKFDGDCAVLSLSEKNAGRKLVCKGEPRGFEVKVGGKWKKAPFAEIDAGKVVIHTDDNSKIEGVRYLWNAWVGDDVCLWLEDDMPLFPIMVEKNN